MSSSDQPSSSSNRKRYWPATTSARKYRLTNSNWRPATFVRKLGRTEQMADRGGYRQRFGALDDLQFRPRIEIDAGEHVTPNTGEDRNSCGHDLHRGDAEAVAAAR